MRVCGEILCSVRKIRFILQGESIIDRLIELACSDAVIIAMNAFWVLKSVFAIGLFHGSGRFREP
jgi:hypothetical protein